MENKRAAWRCGEPGMKQARDNVKKRNAAWRGCHTFVSFN